MKKILFLTIIFSGIVSAQFVESIKYVTATITRDSVAAVYAANDAVSNDRTSPSLLVFEVGRSNGIGGRIVSATLLSDTANTTNGTFDLILFSDSASVTAGVDTAAYALTAVRASKFINKIAFTLATYGTGTTYNYAITNGIVIPFVPIARSKNIYGQLIATGAWQPKAAGVLTIKLGYIQE